MQITIDGVIEPMQPDSLNWGQPRTLGDDGQGSPVRAPNWTCRLAFSRLTSVQYQNWFDAWSDRALHTIGLPHPATGQLTSYSCYVREFVPRFNVRDKCEAAAQGVDITLTRVAVT